MWILGSSTFGAELAAELGLPFAFASHFAPQQMMDAIALYRARFKPSEQLDRPYVMLGFNVIAADSDDEGELLATSLMQAFVALRSATSGQAQAAAGGLCRHRSRSNIARCCASVLSCSAIGAPETVRAQITASSTAPAPTN